MSLNGLDAALIAAVTVMGTAAAYLRNPRWKALMLCIPVPFTLATLALGEPVEATHAGAMVLLMGYTFSVWLMHARLRLPIIVAITASAAGYCQIGTVLARCLPRTGAAFWAAWGVASVTALVLYVTLPHREEPGHQSPLPLWIKAPAIAGVVLMLVAMKQALHGFMAAFPMVGVVTSYEARRSLWTVWRHIPVIVLAFAPMLAILRLTQTALGLGGALALGWAGYATALVPLLWRMWTRDPETPEGT